MLNYLQSHGARTFSIDVIAIVVSLTEHPTCVRSQKYGALPAATTSDTGLKRSVLRKYQLDLDSA